MSSRITLFVYVILTGLVLSPIRALASNPHFTAIYVFGDSYCDVGNIYAATGGAEPAAPYFGGRFSNGPLWLEHVSNAWGLPAMKPSLLGGNNYAFGGAEVTADVPLGGPNFIPASPIRSRSTSVITVARPIPMPSTSLKAAATTSSTPPEVRLSSWPIRSLSA